MSTHNLPVPSPLNIEGEASLATEWILFKRNWQNYELATGLL